MPEEISAFEFTYRPFDRNFPIRSMTVLIYARDRKEAELINLANNYKFFEQDSTCDVKEFGGGYRRT